MPGQELPAVAQPFLIDSVADTGRDMPLRRYVQCGQSLRGVQCLDPAMARSWIDLDSNTLLVDAGRYKYRMEVSAACTAVDWSHTLVFRGDPVTGRVCGTLGDAIVTRDYPCTIRSLELLDKEQYKALVKEYEERRKGKRKPAS